MDKYLNSVYENLKEKYYYQPEYLSAVNNFYYQ